MGRLTNSGETPSRTRGDASPVLEVGGLAPLFCLPDADMALFDLAAALRQRLVVLHFYPRDAMPSSLRQAIDFSEREREFRRHGAQVVCVSLDECMTHAGFRDENGISVELLSDADGEVCRLYRVWQERVADGVTRPAVHRATFIVGGDGKLLHADYNIDTRAHTDQVLAQLNSISGSKNGNPQEHRRHA
ncbi:MAG: peroxiredoxin [Candidatus Dactylopiibacterium sp.]|nr:peroxiredoxin [Candidatus Dactylopiibacterium sp.]